MSSKRRMEAIAQETLVLVDFMTDGQAWRAAEVALSAWHALRCRDVGRLGLCFDGREAIYSGGEQIPTFIDGLPTMAGRQWGR